MSFVGVGQVGNAADSGGYGDVAYWYGIGQFEVTAAEYATFLNAVAASDPYGLYNTSMAGDSAGCNIIRSGSSGSYTYSVAADYANRPTNFVSWFDAARMANWMTTGNTESGVYTFLGGVYQSTMSHTAAAALYTFVYFIPTEDEWYKAAYYSGSGNVYYDYPTGSNTAPSNVLSDPAADPGNNATYYTTDYTIGTPYYRTEVGAHENSESPFQTYDQGGNVQEWNETQAASAAERILRGGSWEREIGQLMAATRISGLATTEADTVGFRFAFIPEPGSLGLLALGLAGMMIRRRRTDC